MDLNDRQRELLKLVEERGPITGEELAKLMNLSRNTLRPDLTVLTMLGFLGARPKVGYFYRGRPPREDVESFMRSIPVSSRMSLPVVIDENSSVYDAIVEIFTENVGTIFITQDGFLSGCVSRKDLLRTAIGKLDLTQTPVSMVMTRMPNIVGIHPGQSMLEAAKLIDGHRIDALPVWEGQEGKYRVVGRITKTNITRFVLELGGNDESYFE
ncbi:MAG: helix-turn-helix transcriptional regulator [Tissierellia bacterium]|nr:helix-turn-helix transcriptional regulator [Tissierellia bacterium]